MSNQDPLPGAAQPDADPDDDWIRGLRKAASAYPSGGPRAAMHERHQQAIRTVLDTRVGAPLPPREGAPEFPGLELLGELAPGVGGMGTVYLARERSLDRTVAVKTVNRALETPSGREIFVREARAVAQLDHPHIVRIFSFDPDHDPPYYVMEYVDGEPIDRACRGKTETQIAELLESTARAVACAHAHGILHRDIKPDNVLVDHKGAPRITDFGLASRWGAARDKDDPAPVAGGTPSYLPPRDGGKRQPPPPRWMSTAWG